MSLSGHTKNEVGKVRFKVEACMGMSGLKTRDDPGAIIESLSSAFSACTGR